MRPISRSVLVGSLVSAVSVSMWWNGEIALIQAGSPTASPSSPTNVA